MAHSPKMPCAFAVLTAVVLILVIVLVWMMALQEDEKRGLLAEYEAFRASSSLAEELRRDPAAELSVDPHVLGYGLYDLAGKAVRREGSAPEMLEALPDLEPYRGDQGTDGFPGGIDTRISDKGKSYILYRFLGPQNAMRGMGLRHQSSAAAGNTGAGNQSGDTAPSSGGAVSPPSLPQSGMPSGMPPFGMGQSAPQGGQTYQLWMEYDVAGAFAERTLYIAIAIAVTLIMAAFYYVLITLFGRNERLRDREAATRELVQLGEAARTLVHEIKNPLGIMRIQSAGIRRKATELSSASEAAAAKTGLAIVESSHLMDAEITRLADLADRIREFLKAGEGNAVRIDLAAFLGDFVSRYVAQGKRDCLILELQGNVAASFVRIDPDRLTQALDNLVRNAIEANEAADKADSAVILSLGQKGREWVLAVADSGSGVNAEDLPRLFEPFFTTKEKGSGIGLALAKRIAESAGGGIRYENGRQGGSVFSLSLPAAAVD